MFLTNQFSEMCKHDFTWYEKTVSETRLAYHTVHKQTDVMENPIFNECDYPSPQKHI